MIDFFLELLKRPGLKTFRRRIRLPVSFPRRRESSLFSEAILQSTWMPASAGMTIPVRNRVVLLTDLLVRTTVLMVLVGGLLSFVATAGFSSGVARAADAKPAWQREWEKVLAAARKEGQVAVYISGYESVLPEFEKEYPDIKLIAVTARGSQLGQRLVAERRGDKFLADVVSAGGVTTLQQLHFVKVLDPIKPALILPEVTDQSKWYQKRHQYSDAEGKFIFNYVGSATYGAVNYNTNLVDVKEFKSYWDLLNPKWKGKIISRDIRSPGPGSGNARLFYYHPDIGPSFIKKLYGEMDVTMFRDYRQGPDWLAVGKYAICFFCDTDILKQQGLPVDTFGPKVFKEGGGLVQQFGTLTLVNKAPHPNAARVFINWLLSRKGQIALQKVTLTGESPADSLRTDIPKNEVPLINRRIDGVKYIDTGRPEWVEMTPILDVMTEALKTAGKN